MPNANGHIALIATGGTISQGPEGALGAASLIRLAASTRRLPADVPIRGTDLASSPSSEATVDSIHALAACAAQRVADPGCFGVVVTHGTDAMEEVSLACELLLGKINKPVVFTGAMIPPKHRGTDAHQNLVDALRAAHTSSGLRGLCVAMTGRLHMPLEVRKANTSARDAFVSPPLGPFGLITDAGVELVREPVRLGLVSPRLEGEVELVRLTAGGGPRLLQAAIELGARGIVLELFGAGNVGQDVCRSVARATERGVAVLACSRVGLGELTPGSGVLAAGAIPATLPGTGQTLGGLSARIVLMAALGAGLDRDRISRLFGPANEDEHEDQDGDQDDPRPGG
ncbi:MAG: asparaginase [Planctomycetota bacterium]